MKVNKDNLMVFAIFIGLKLLELAAIAGACAIIWLLYLIISLNCCFWVVLIGKLFVIIGIIIGACFYLFIAYIVISEWLKSNWKKAKRIKANMGSKIKR